MNAIESNDIYVIKNIHGEYFGDLYSYNTMVGVSGRYWNKDVKIAMKFHNRCDANEIVGTYELVGEVVPMRVVYYE